MGGERGDGRWQVRWEWEWEREVDGKSEDRRRSLEIESMNRCRSKRFGHGTKAVVFGEGSPFPDITC